jgi:hypothetical protein
MSISTQICWKQPWGSDALALLRVTGMSLGLVVKELASQEWNPATATIDGIRDVDLSYIGAAGDAWTFFHLPLDAKFSDVFAVNLSTTQANPIIEFHEYYDTCWGYRLIKKGIAIDYFVNEPFVLEEEPSRCFGSADMIARVFKVPQRLVAPYIRHLAVDEDLSMKAHPDDEYPLSNHWVRVDFMRRLGIRYLDPSAGKGLYLHITMQ